MWIQRIRSYTPRTQLFTYIKRFGSFFYHHPFVIAIAVSRELCVSDKGMNWEEEEEEEEIFEEFNEEEEGGGEEEEEEEEEEGEAGEGEIPVDFDFFTLLSNPKDYYKILEVDTDATEDTIRSNYIRLALKWHPDKRKDEDSSTSRFQEINEAYSVLIDPVKRKKYDKKRMLFIYDQNLMEYFDRYKGLILTCNGLGIQHSIW